MLTKEPAMSSQAHPETSAKETGQTPRKVVAYELAVSRWSG